MSTVEDASCRGAEKDLWFSTDKDDIEAAKEICSGCPIKDACLSLVDGEDVPGVWGGLTQNERKDRNRTLGIDIVVDPAVTMAVAPRRHRDGRPFKWHPATTTGLGVCRTDMTMDQDMTRLAAEVPVQNRCSHFRCAPIWRQLDILAVRCA